MMQHAQEFVAMILTHGRPDRVATYDTLRKYGYTGRIVLVVDNEDATRWEYIEKFGEENVVTFSKREAAEYTDDGDNFKTYRGVIYARNASFEIAKGLGFRYFIQLDDDYTGFYYRFDKQRKYGVFPIRSLDNLFDGLVDFLSETPFLSVAISQGGDHFGGGAGPQNSKIGTRRKAMNTFVCDVQRPFRFFGRINEDTTTTTELQRRGGLFLTFQAAQVNQRQTQSNAGGMTELYLDSGTYVKSFYSVMYAPSCVVVAPLRDPRAGAEYAGGQRPARIHHRIRWDCAAPMILPESVRKPRA